MKKIVLIVCLIALAGCSDEKPAPIVKTTHAEIEQRFSENGAAAELYFKGKVAEITDTINSIQSGGTVVLVDDSLHPYVVTVYPDSYEFLAKKKTGDKLTVRCNYVDAGLIGQCDVKANAM